MKSFDSIFLFTKKEGTASAYLLTARQGEPFAPLETENSNGERVCYLTKIQGKATARRKPSWNVSIPKINARKLGLRTENLSGVFIPSPEAANKGFGDCRYSNNGYLFQLDNDTLTILVFKGQANTVEQVLFYQFLDGEFDFEIAEFLSTQTTKAAQ